MPTPELTPEQLQSLADINKPFGDNPDYGSPAKRMVLMRNVFTGKHEWVPYPYEPVGGTSSSKPTESEIRGEMDAEESLRLSRQPPRPTGFTS